MRACALALLLLCSPANAAPCERAAQLTEGQAAPCDGDLVPAPVLMRLLDAVVERNACRERLVVNATEHAAQLGACNAGWDACEDEPAVVVVKRGWSTGAVVGVVVAAVVVAGFAGYGIGSLSTR